MFSLSRFCTMLMVVIALVAMGLFSDTSQVQAQCGVNGQAQCGAPSVSAANRLLATQLTTFNQFGGASAAASTAVPPSGFAVPQGYVLVPQSTFQGQAFVPAPAAAASSAVTSSAAVPTTTFVVPQQAPTASASAAASGCSSGQCGGGRVGLVARFVAALRPASQVTIARSKTITR